MKLVLTRSPQANADAINTYQYIGGESPNAAEEYFDALFTAFDTIVMHPEIGTTFTQAKGELAALRVMPVSAKFNKHMIFYIPSESEIRVIRILHSSRDIEPLFAEE